MRRTIIYCFVSLIFFITGCQHSSDKLLEEGEFELEEGLRLKLIASDPLIQSPVSFTFDEEGYLYVVEDKGYPSSVPNPRTDQGRIVRLEDTDGDGLYDKRTVFADGFSYPNGIIPWKGGVFITCAPDILYLKDTTGDGVADINKVVLTGFNDNKTSQIRVSSPILGLDGWIYVAGGLNGGKITSPDYSDRDTVEFVGADGRFHPDTYEFEVTGGESQFGLTFDSYGRRFGNSNRHPGQQIVMEPSYLNRNPYYQFTKTIENVSKFGEDGIVFPISKVATTSEYIPSLMGKSHKGSFTSACGILVFQGDNMGSDHVGDIFICEPAQNLVQRQVLEPKGVTFKGILPYEDKEFFASRDEGFRPVFLGNGPGGGLYVADMIRKIIDEPAYIPEGVRDTLDYVTGKDQGKIYEIVKKDHSFNSEKFPGPSASLDQLISMLGSTNGWDRETAFRILLEGKDKQAVPDLKDCASNCKYPESRVRAFWLLNLFGELDAKVLVKGLNDENPGVRENAVLLVQKLPTLNEEVKEEIIALVEDSNERVRFATALTLGSLQDDPIITETLAKLAIKDGQDEWMRAALLSGIGDKMEAFLNHLQDQKETQTDQSYALVMEDMGEMFGIGAAIESNQRLGEIAINSIASGEKISWQYPTLLGLAKGLNKRPNYRSEEKGFHQFLNSLFGDLPSETESRFKRDLIKDVNNKHLPEDVRIKTIKLLGFVKIENTNAVLEKILETDDSAEIQRASIGALSEIGTKEAAHLMIGENVWRKYDSQTREAVINTLLSKKIFTEILLDGIQDGILSASEVPSNRRSFLLNNKDIAIQKKAKEAFADLEGGDRMEAYREYEDFVKKSKGDPQKGEPVFQNTCARCHSYAETKGNDVGPDLTDIRNQPAEAILLHIIIPNYEVYPQYQTIHLETKEGEFFAGWAVSQNDNNITLRMSDGSDETISKSNIDSYTNTGKSLMPDGLEQTMSKEEMTDLIAFLKSGGNLN